MVFEKVSHIIGKVLQNPHLDLSKESSSKDVVGWDSLRHMMIISEVEEAFGISIEFDEILEIKTIDDICQIVSKKIK